MGERSARTGRPTTGADVRIVDPDGSIDDGLPPGHTGEILVTGSSVAVGYRRDPALTAKKFVDAWWRSGDLGHLDEDGYLWVSGRADKVINTGGIKVHAEEIESGIMTHEEVSACAIIGRTDARAGQRVVAYIVARDSGLTANVVPEGVQATQRLQGTEAVSHSRCPAHRPDRRARPPRAACAERV